MTDPTNVFLDTQAVEGQLFDTQSTAFSALAGLQVNGQVQLYTTDVTQREIRQRISKRIAEARPKAWDALLRVALRHNGTPDDLITALSESVEALLWEHWQRYCAVTKMVEIPTTTVAISDILDGYFSLTPPFSEHKPHEFPDAIAFRALTLYAARANLRIHVVSSDPDWQAACGLDKRLVHVRSLEAVLDVANSRKQLADRVREAIERKLEDIAKRVSAETDSRLFYFDGGGGRVLSVTFRRWLTTAPPMLLNLDEGSNEALAYWPGQVEAEVMFEAADKHGVPMQSATLRSVPANVTLWLDTSDNNDVALDVISVELDRPYPFSPSWG